MTQFLLEVFWQTWNIFKQASVFLLFGFLIAGVLAVLVPERLLTRLFSRGKVKSVLWASTVGAPLPLCSCGVVPAALSLRRQGATPGATGAFLISTPETGVDSISLTYALMDPIMTVFRPLTAMATAVAAGLGINAWGKRDTNDELPPADAAEQVSVHGAEQPHIHAHDHCVVGEESQARTKTGRLRHTAWRVYDYAFNRLLDDISYWVVLGIVLSAIVAAAFPPTFFEQYLNDPLTAMLVMLVIGIPIYVCASEATPVAAALVMKGLNPGAALVFLLAGPATNIGTIVMLVKFMGKRFIAIYLLTIASVALLAGYAVNWVYRAWEIDPRATFGAATAIIPEPVKIGGALLLITLLLLSMRRTPIPAEWFWVRDRLARWTGVRVTATRTVIALGSLAAVLYIGSGLFVVQPGEAAVRMRFGAIVSDPLAPGLHYRLPWPFGSHRVVGMERVQRVEFGFPTKAPAITSVNPVARGGIIGYAPMPEDFIQSGTWFQREAQDDEPFLLTGDMNLIDLRWAVQYRVKDAVAFTLNVAEPEPVVRGIARAALRTVVARTGIDDLYTSKRSVVETQALRLTQATLDRARTGLEMVAFQLLYVHPPDEVHDAFRDVASAQEDKMRTINRASTFAVETVNGAKGEAAAMIEESLAFEHQLIAHARGDAGSFALKLGAYRLAPDITRFRLQVETIEATLPGLQKFVTPEAGDMKDFDMWLLQPVGVSGGR